MDVVINSTDLSVRMSHTHERELVHLLHALELLHCLLLLHQELHCLLLLHQELHLLLFFLLLNMTANQVTCGWVWVCRCVWVCMSCAVLCMSVRIGVRMRVSDCVYVH